MRRFVLIIPAFSMLLPHVALGQSILNLTPSRVVGQPSLTFRSASPNVVEGREFYNPYEVAVDTSTPAGAVYVSDLGNNRVLGWRNGSSFANGAKADVVLGQVDFVSTTPLGPSTSRTSGLSAPTGLAVDSSGNVYVMDAGNNRILRFPRPMESREDIQIPDMVIGQSNLSSSLANNGGVSEKTLALSSGGVARSAMSFDAQGNLWVTDPLNNRVLRYPAAALAEGSNQPAADLVLGQPDFVTSALLVLPTPAPTPAVPNPLAPNPALSKQLIRNPSTVLVDAAGRVYVADTFGRVMVYQGPLVNGKEASRIAGLMITVQGQPNQLEYLLQAPTGMTLDNNRLVVSDAGLNRVVVYDPFTSWPEETELLPSPPAKIVIGQQNFQSFLANRGLAEASGATLSSPAGIFWTGTELFLVDSGNHRLLVFPSVAATTTATRVLGQPDFNLNAANRPDGREFFLFNGFGGGNLAGDGSDGAGIAIDTRSATPYLYVSDTFNNRILGFRDARRIRPGDKADIIIGQTDFQRNLINSPSNSRDNLTSAGLFRPSGLAVDASGNLYVADSGNGRVLRFPQPFAQSTEPGQRQRADLVLGQLSFSQRLADPSARNMAFPVGLAFTVEGSLLVSDAVHARILFFRKPANADFVNGQAAERVIGQPDFFTVGRSAGFNRLAGPRGISIDTDDRLYVADTGNNRIQVYDRITVVNNDPAPAFTLAGISGPQGVWVSPITGEIWVANSRGSNAVRYPRFERLAIDTRPDYSIPSGAPLALTQDSAGNLYVAEGVNRIAVYFNALTAQIAANYSTRPLSPGTIAILYPAGGFVTFADPGGAFSTMPLPFELGDTQVLLSEKPVPLYYVGPTQINFQVPFSAPDSGTAEIQVIRKSTNQIIAVGQFQFDKVSPALFVQGGAIQGQLAALNEDNTVNTPANPAQKNHFITLFGTGLGFVPGAPDDGSAPTGPLNMPDRPRVFLGGKDFIKDEDIQYAGLAPGLVGVWQINAKIPDDAVPGLNDAFVAVRSVSSNRTGTGAVIRTTISVKQ